MIFPGLSDIEIVFEEEVQEKETQCMAKYLSGDIQTMQNNGSIPLERQIVEILCGSKKTRNGPRPSKANIDFAENIVKRYTSLGEPIRAVTLWGPVKGYWPGIYECPDVADVLALRRYVLLNELVRQVYEPGLLITIHPEDTGKIARLQHKEKEYIVILEKAMNEYGSGMNDLIEVLGAEEFVSWVPESQIYESRGITQGMFNSQVRQNFEIFHEYWLASAKMSETERQNIHEFKELKRVGWQGPITNGERLTYIKRALNQGAKTKDEAVTHACMYLAAAFSRNQFQLIKPRVSDDDGDIPLMKATFVPYPAGTPENLHRGRFDYKLKDTQGKRSGTPWSFGVIVENADFYAYPSFLSTPLAVSSSQKGRLRESELITHGEKGKCTINCYKSF